MSDPSQTTKRAAYVILSLVIVLPLISGLMYRLGNQNGFRDGLEAGFKVGQANAVLSHIPVGMLF